MAGQRDQEPETDRRHRPGTNQREDQHELKKRVSWYPESPSRDTAAMGLNKIGTLGPEGVDHRKLVKTTAEQDQGKRRCSHHDTQAKQRHSETPLPISLL